MKVVKSEIKNKLIKIKNLVKKSGNKTSNKSTVARHSTGDLENLKLHSFPKGLYTYFICHPNSKNWILHDIARRISSKWSGPSRIVFHNKFSKFSEARSWDSLFFMHYSLLHSFLINGKYNTNSNYFVWFTHFDGSKYQTLDLLRQTLRYCTHIFVPNTAAKQFLISLGLQAHQITVVIGGYDPQKYTGHQREDGKICFVSGYYERKNPKRILDFVEFAKDENFLLIGPKNAVNKTIIWRNSPEADRINSLANLELIECDWEQNPNYIRECDIYMSFADNEGGPIPLLEAMAENLYPIAFDTGFAREDRKSVV